MLPIMSEYGSKAPITSGVQGCNGRCTATIRAPALVPYHCNWNTTWHNFSAPYTRNEWEEFHAGAVPDTRLLFQTTLTSRYGARETLNLHTYISGDQIAKTCAGLVNSTHCYLRSAIAEYEVLITNETIILKDPANPRFISWANNTAVTNETIDKFDLRENASGLIKTTLGGIVQAFESDLQFSGNALPRKEEDPDTPGVLMIALLRQPWFMYQQTTNYEQYNDNETCSYAWGDVRSATMAAMNELMFRIGVYVGQNYNYASLKDLLDPGVETNYTVIGRASSEVFHTDFVYYIVAAALELSTITLVASTFWGYWRLGRHVSFSPLEIAKVS